MTEMNSNTMSMIVKTYEHEGQTLNVSFTEAGFFNATAVAKTFGKQPRDWLVTSPVKEYIKYVANSMKVNINQLVIVRGGSPDVGGGTWIHKNIKDRFICWLEQKKTSHKDYHLYVLLFSTGIIKVGVSYHGQSRIKQHVYEAQKYGVSVIRNYISLNPKVTEKELIDYCSSISNRHVGKEYFSELNFDDAVSFIEAAGKALRC